jgi:hypothetical protein
MGRQLEGHKSGPGEGQMQIGLAASHLGLEGPFRADLAGAEQKLGLAIRIT